MPIRTRIFLNTLVILLLGMGLVGLLSWRAVEGLYLETQRENLLAQAQLSAAALQGQPLPELSAHDARELVKAGAAQDTKAAQQAEKELAKASESAQAEFEAARA